MPRVPFDQLPPAARIWIFPASRPLSPAEGKELLSRVDAFLEEWAAHGARLTAGREWREGRFLVIGVDETTAPPSGCSTDSLTGVLKDLGREWGMSFLDRSPVWYRSDGALVSSTRGEFRSLAEDGKVDLETPVIDLALTRRAQLTGGEWEKPAGLSWHRRAFFSEAPPEDSPV